MRQVGGGGFQHETCVGGWFPPLSPGGNEENGQVRALSSTPVWGFIGTMPLTIFEDAHGFPLRSQVLSLTGEDLIGAVDRQAATSKALFALKC